MTDAQIQQEGSRQSPRVTFPDMWLPTVVGRYLVLGLVTLL